MLNEAGTPTDACRSQPESFYDPAEADLIRALRKYIAAGGTAQRMMELVSTVMDNEFVSVAGRVLRGHQEELGVIRELPARAQIAENTRRREEEIVQAGVKIALLDLVTPNGKKLRDCTRQDCRKLGGFYSRVADYIEGDRTVGMVLSETQVRKLLRGA